ncbi:Z-ring formation inhibitor MciZ [Brevibacillus sp. SYSU BS000544]
MKVLLPDSSQNVLVIVFGKVSEIREYLEEYKEKTARKRTA